MSQSHIRVRNETAGKQRSYWFETTILVVTVLLALLYVATRFWSEPSNPDYETADAKVSETRIVVDHIRDSYYGGSIFYRIEAHAQYGSDGRPQDRWLTASEVTTDRWLLASKVAIQPERCEAYWVSGHPENARCRLK